MEITNLHDRWDEDDFRERRFLPVHQASAEVWHPEVARMILEVPGMLEGL